MVRGRRRRRDTLIWWSGKVQSYDGYEFGQEIPPERANWIWDFNDQRYYQMFDVGPDQFELLPHAESILACWVGSSVHANQGHDRLRMHLIAGCYMDIAGRYFPLWWCCEVLGAYVRPEEGARCMMMLATPP